MVVGSLPTFLERSELAEQDIVTFSYGDASGLYLRGQFTIHRNDHSINDLWRQCSNLGSGLEAELQHKVSFLERSEAAGSSGAHQHTRFVSAEGCYSKVALAAGVRFKIAPKQAIGLDIRSTASAVWAGGAVWHCSAATEPDASLLQELAAAGVARRCYLHLPSIQPAVGGASPVEVRDTGCGDWISPECRLCAADPPADGSSIAYYARDGKVHSRRIDSSALALPSPNAHGCHQAAIFHFQEWKKHWDGNADVVDVLSPADTVDPGLAFHVSTAGIRRLRF
mmetsp:Transcript_12566/g.36837  ORF Transcript_12566/g.36837 Transcript_12566/m.36837 type:complete len:282 (+) Transcript_12566:524-1369(+)